MTNAKERLKTGRIEMSIHCGNWKFTGDFRAEVQGEEGQAQVCVAWWAGSGKDNVGSWLRARLGREEEKP